MADVTDAPVPTGSSPFDVPGDLSALADHFGDPAMFSVAIPADLPAAVDNWPGRQVYVRSDKSFRIWDATAAQWYTLAEIGGSWVNLTPESAYYNIVDNGTWLAAAVRKNGPYTELTGHISTDGSTGVASTWAYVPVGYRPTRRTIVHARTVAHGTFVFAASVDTSGNLIVESNISTGAANVLFHAVWLNS